MRRQPGASNPEAAESQQASQKFSSKRSIGVRPAQPTTCKWGRLNDRRGEVRRRRFADVDWRIPFCSCQSAGRGHPPPRAE